MKFIKPAVLLFLLQLSIPLIGQNILGVELQIYPTGIIPSMSLDIHHNEKESIYLRVGYNAFDHRSLGVHSEEKGGGIGGSLGYKRYLDDKNTWRLGLKTDIWWNDVEWKDKIIGGPDQFGNTDIIVLQPTIEIGYALRFNNFLFIPTLATGYEWNIKTEGEETGQGPILLIGFSLGKML